MDIVHFHTFLHIHLDYILTMATPASRLVQAAKTLKELRVHVCQKAVASQGTRQFLEKYYGDVKKQNPKLPILVREAVNVQPKIWARYESGVERSFDLTGKSSDEVFVIFKTVAESTRLEKPEHFRIDNTSNIRTKKFN